jgi:hypothetical protein
VSSSEIERSVVPLSSGIQSRPWRGWRSGLPTQTATSADLLEGTGTQVRYVTIRELDDIREQELTVLIAEAAAVAATVRRGR